MNVNRYKQINIFEEVSVLSWRWIIRCFIDVYVFYCRHAVRVWMW